MYLTTLPLTESVGHLLCHNLADAQGRKAFKKGHRVHANDLPALEALGYHQLRVAVVEPADVHEDEAARRLGLALTGPGVTAANPAAGRVNLLATQSGLLTIDLESLRILNSIDGLTVATLPRHRVVDERTILATIKIIPYAVPESDIVRAETNAQPISVLPLHPARIGIILVGHPNAEQRVRDGVYPAIASRVEELGAHVATCTYVPQDEATVAAAITEQRQQGVELLILAGETSVMDRYDIIPEGIVAAGGQVLHYGAPVEPGNLLLLAEVPPLVPTTKPIPVIGAPGCVRSRNTNVVDLILPRLLAGQHLDRYDIVDLGHGGLLG